MTDISGVAKGARAVHVSLVSCAGVRFDCVGAVPNVETLEAAHCWAEACVLGDNHVAAVLCGLPTLRQVVLRACHWEDHRGPRVLESDVPISETLSLWRFRRNLDGISNKAVRLLAIM